MKKTHNLGLSLYETTDKFNITKSEDSLNHNMELIDDALGDIKVPVKGEDYWTEEDKAHIVQEVIDSVIVQYPEAHVIYGDVDSNNVITIYGELPDGTYTLKYESEDGSTIDIGSLNINGTTSDSYTNQIPISIDENGEIYNGIGYKENTRINSSGIPDALTDTVTKPVFITGLIPVKKGDIIRLKNCFIDTANKDMSSIYGIKNWAGQIAYYDSISSTTESNTLSLRVWTDFANLSDPYQTNSPYFKDVILDDNGYVTQFTFDNKHKNYIRFTLACDGDPADAIITVNEEIV